MTTKDPSKFWRLFKTPHSDACPVELSAQFEAFTAVGICNVQIVCILQYDYTDCYARSCMQHDSPY